MSTSPFNSGDPMTSRSVHTLRFISDMRPGLLRILLVLVQCLWLGAQITVGQQGEITVGRNVQVSKSRSDLVHNEVLLSVDPANPSRLLGCTMAFSPEQNKMYTIAYVSFDAGKSWNLAVENKGGVSSADPACTYGVNGSAYFTTMDRLNSGRNHLLAYRSQDAGRTWSSPMILYGSGPSVDRPYVVADQSASSYKGRVYVYGQITQRTVNGESLGRSIALWRSRDGGVTYEGPIVRSPDSRITFLPANGVVLSDGTLVCLIAELDSQKRNDGYVGSQYRKADVQNGTLKVLVSNDGGETLAPAYKISDMYEDWREEAHGLASLAADPGSTQFKDRVYAAWADGRYGRTQILLSYSTDKGRTWSKPQLVSDDQPTIGDGPDNFMPVVAVNADGVVGVMWYDRRDTAGTLGFYTRFTASLDGGDTWLPSVRVSEAPRTIDEHGSVVVRGYVLGADGPPLVVLRRYEWIAGGHTAGLAADSNGVFHPFWVDNRTGISQIWTSSVTVRGTAMRNGSIELAKLQDVSRATSLQLTNCAHESAGNIVSCSARLKNISKVALEGPRKVRVIALKSELGEPIILNAGNGHSGAGAVWDFTGKVKEGTLQPDEMSDGVQLRFKISKARPFRQGNLFKTSFVEMDVRVLGRTKEMP
jgi:hypothetical protein